MYVQYLTFLRWINVGYNIELESNFGKKHYSENCFREKQLLHLNSFLFHQEIIPIIK